MGLSKKFLSLHNNATASVFYFLHWLLRFVFFSVAAVKTQWASDATPHHRCCRAPTGRWVGVGSGVWIFHLHWLLLRLSQSHHGLFQRHPDHLRCLLQSGGMDLLHHACSHVRCRWVVLKVKSKLHLSYLVLSLRIITLTELMFQHIFPLGYIRLSYETIGS